jgi:hypothetical protein
MTISLSSTTLLMGKVVLVSFPNYQAKKEVDSPVWDLSKYERMHHLLQDVDQDKYGQVRVAIGAEDDEFFLETDHTIHCPNKNNRLTDEVEEMTHKEVKMVGLGLDVAA